MILTQKEKRPMREHRTLESYNKSPNRTLIVAQKKIIVNRRREK